MDQPTIEGLANAAYREAALSPEEPHVFRLARQLLGPHAIRKGPRPLHGPAALVRFRNDWTIFVSRALSPAMLAFSVGHELGHWLLRREGYSGADEERVADSLGAALVTPRAAFRAAYRAHGDCLPNLAAALCVTETGAALRLGEVIGQPLAVVAPATVRVRGPSEWCWPDDGTLRRWARSRAPGLRKTRLQDDPRRVVLQVETVEG